MRRSTHRKISATIAIVVAIIAVAALFFFFTFPLWMLIAIGVGGGILLGGLYYLLSKCCTNGESVVEETKSTSENSKQKETSFVVKDNHILVLGEINKNSWSSAMNALSSSRFIDELVIETPVEETLQKGIQRYCKRTGLKKLIIAGKDIPLEGSNKKPNPMALVLRKGTGASLTSPPKIVENRQSSWFYSTSIYNSIHQQLKKHFNYNKGKKIVREPIPSSSTVPRTHMHVTYEEMESSRSLSDWFSILGIPPDADTESIKKAVKESFRDFHPDKIGDRCDDLDIFYLQDGEAFHNQLEKWKQEYKPEVTRILFIFSTHANEWIACLLKEGEENPQIIPIAEDSIFKKELDQINADNFRNYDKRNIQKLLEENKLFEGYITLKQRYKDQFVWVQEAAQELLSKTPGGIEWLKSNLSLNVVNPILSNQIKIRTRQYDHEHQERLKEKEKYNRQLEEEKRQTEQVLKLNEELKAEKRRRLEEVNKKKQKENSEEIRENQNSGSNGIEQSCPLTDNANRFFSLDSNDHKNLDDGGPKPIFNPLSDISNVEFSNVNEDKEKEGCQFGDNDSCNSSAFFQPGAMHNNNKNNNNIDNSSQNLDYGVPASTFNLLSDTSRII